MNQSPTPLAADGELSDPLTDIVSGHAPSSWREDVPAAALPEIQSFGYQTGFHVLVTDIRKSTLLMKEAVSAANHVSIINSFVTFSREVVLHNKGWYDKFTGDGFIAYWIYGRDDIERHLSDVLSCAREIQLRFEGVIKAFRQNSRNFPTGVGIALGLDSGQCPLLHLGGTLTVVGAPMVGARRMVDAAGPAEMLCNVFLGEVVESNRELQEKLGFQTQRVQVKTKEYPEGQEAYRIMFGSNQQ